MRGSDGGVSAGVTVRRGVHVRLVGRLPCHGQIGDSDPVLGLEALRTGPFGPWCDKVPRGQRRRMAPVLASHFLDMHPSGGLRRRLEPLGRPGRGAGRRGGGRPMLRPASPVGLPDGAGRCRIPASTTSMPLGRTPLTFVSDLEPTALWRHFDTILTIPRASKDEGRMRNHIVESADRLGLAHHADRGRQPRRAQAGHAGARGRRHHHPPVPPRHGSGEERGRRVRLRHRRHRAADAGRVSDRGRHHPGLGQRHRGWRRCCP